MRAKTTIKQRPLSAQFADRLRLQLSNGHFAPGQRYYSNNSLADEFGISAPTASKIIDELCREGLVCRLNGSGTYVTEKVLSHTVATYVMVEWMELHHPGTYRNLGYRMVIDFERACTREGRRAHVINPHDGDCLDLLRDLIDHGLDGAFLLPTYADPMMLRVMDMLTGHGVPLVHWASSPEDDIPGSIGIGFDDTQCGRTATQHLLALGHRHIAAVGRSWDGLWGQRRIEGCQAALAHARIAKGDRIVELLARDQLTPSALTSFLNRLHDQGVTAIMATNDILAKELMLAARATGLTVPDQLSITGVDNRDDSPLIGLTTIERPPQAIADQALALLEQLRLDRHAVAAPPPVECPLIVRRTTGAPPG